MNRRDFIKRATMALTALAIDPSELIHVPKTYSIPAVTKVEGWEKAYWHGLSPLSSGKPLVPDFTFFSLMKDLPDVQTVLTDCIIHTYDTPGDIRGRRTAEGLLELRNLDTGVTYYAPANQLNRPFIRPFVDADYGNKGGLRELRRREFVQKNKVQGGWG